MRRGRNLLQDRSAATAAEFALVLPLLLLLLFGIIDAGRFLWQLNRAEKATQAGVRFAAVTNLVPSGLAAYKFTTGSEAIPPGTTVPASAFDGAECNSAGCSNTTCTASGAGPAPGFDATAFDAIGDRMRRIYPQISNDDFTITYCNVGLGYAGDPYGADVSPQITIALSGLSFTPLTSLMFATITMPPAASTMTLEDGVGSQSN